MLGFWFQMSTSHFQIRQCERKDCLFRFPVIENSSLGKECPQCGTKTRLVDAQYQSHEVKTKHILPGGPEVEVLLDNIRSTFNVGSIFRTADGAGIRHLHLCGITPTPDNPKLAKTALGAEYAVAWSKHSDGLTAAVSLKKQGMRLWALEGGPHSKALFEAIADLEGPPIVLAIGNEVSGVDPGILEKCDRALYIPMQGAKGSLNVAVAFGIASYILRYAPNFQESRIETT